MEAFRSFSKHTIRIEHILYKSRIAREGPPPIPAIWQHSGAVFDDYQPQPHSPKTPVSKKRKILKQSAVDQAASSSTPPPPPTPQQNSQTPQQRKHKKSARGGGEATSTRPAPACASFHTYCLRTGALGGTVLFTVVDTSPEGALQPNQYAGVVNSCSTNLVFEISEKKSNPTDGSVDDWYGGSSSTTLSFLLIPYYDALTDPLKFSLDDPDNAGAIKARDGLEYILVELVPTKKKTISPIDNPKYDLLIFETALPASLFGQTAISNIKNRFLVCNREALRAHIYDRLPKDLNSAKLTVSTIRNAVYKFYRKGRQNRMATLVPTENIVAENLGYYI